MSTDNTTTIAPEATHVATPKRFPPPEPLNPISKIPIHIYTPEASGTCTVCAVDFFQHHHTEAYLQRIIAASHGVKNWGRLDAKRRHFFKQYARMWIDAQKEISKSQPQPQPQPKP